MLLTLEQLIRAQDLPVTGVVEVEMRGSHRGAYRRPQTSPARRPILGRALEKGLDLLKGERR